MQYNNNNRQPNAASWNAGWQEPVYAQDNKYVVTGNDTALSHQYHSHLYDSSTMPRSTMAPQYIPAATHYNQHTHAHDTSALSVQLQVQLHVPPDDMRCYTTSTVADVPTYNASYNVPNQRLNSEWQTYQPKLYTNNHQEAGLGTDADVLIADESWRQEPPESPASNKLFNTPVDKLQRVFKSHGLIPKKDKRTGKTTKSDVSVRLLLHATGQLCLVLEQRIT